MKIDYPKMPHTVLHFQVHLATHCNLNCINCGTYSPLAKESFLDVDEYERDCHRLAELYGSEVSILELLGGGICRQLCWGRNEFL